jgi:integrin alpha FG-GAP repeat containing protein 1
MVFPTCATVSSTGIGSDCYINIAYNKQLPLCSSSTASGLKDGKRICRPPDQLCTADPNFSFDLGEKDDNDVSRQIDFCPSDCAHFALCNVQAFVRFPTSALFPSSSLLVVDTSYSPSLPIPLKLGDVNLDGFTDLLAIFVSSEGDHTPKVMLSVPCRRGVVGCAGNGSGRRGWRVLEEGAQSLNGVKDARGATFLDMDEDVSCLPITCLQYAHCSANVGHT